MHLATGSWTRPYIYLWPCDILLALLALISCCPEAAKAAESKPVVTAHTQAHLVSDVDSLAPDHYLRLGLHLELKPGWHTYWINPGDAGEAATMTSRISMPGLNAESSGFLWPVPQRISEGGLMAYAYTGDVLLPQNVTFVASSFKNGATAEKQQKLHILSHAEWLVCAEVCVPEEGDFTLDLPFSAAPSVPESKQAPLFHLADRRMPLPSPFNSWLTREGVLAVSGDGLSPDTVKNAWFLPLRGGMIQQTAPQKFEVMDHRILLHLTPDATARPPYWQKLLSGVVVLVDGAGHQKSVQITARYIPGMGTDPLPRGPVNIIPGAIHGWPGLWSASGLSGLHILHILFFALLGGIILNLMPCVFPVLAMKAFSLMRLGGGHRREQLASAAFYTLGVMGSFLVLGALMIILRLAGSAAGWGFQFQSSGFVLFLCGLIFVMALNLLGVFQITFGQTVSGRIAGGKLSGDGPLSGSGAKHHYWHDVLTGLLAVMVATPCTAPFMGVAIASALSGPVLVGLAIFLTMGFGLALPYLLVAVIPGLAARLPHPGPWMEVLKQLLAFPLLASCVWLLWVIGQQRGVDSVGLVLCGAVLLGLALWLYGLGQAQRIRGGKARLVALYYGGSVFCILLVLAGLPVFQEMSPDHAQLSRRAGSVITGMQEKAPVEPFSTMRLSALRAEGRPVFVDMTASWCITCIVNERVALNTNRVQEVFRKHNILTLRGDWTNRDKAITAWLRAQGRDGVPLYIYYPPHGAGRQLPQILTPARILESLRIQ